MIRDIAFCFICAIPCALNAQSPASIGSYEPQIAMVHSSPISYPPMALAARVSGEVNVEVEVRGDGTVNDTTVLSGPQMLRAVVIESVQKSTFSCGACTPEIIKFH